MSNCKFELQVSDQTGAYLNDIHRMAMRLINLEEGLRSDLRLGES